MELNSIEDVKALTEYQKIEQIEKIENKIKRLSHVPATSCAVLIAYSFFAYYTGNVTWSPSNFMFIGVVIGSVGQSNIKRTDLLKQLFELKYGK